MRMCWQQWKMYKFKTISNRICHGSTNVMNANLTMFFLECLVVPVAAPHQKRPVCIQQTHRTHITIFHKAVTQFAINHMPCLGVSCLLHIVQHSSLHVTYSNIYLSNGSRIIHWSICSICMRKSSNIGTVQAISWLLLLSLLMVLGWFIIVAVVIFNFITLFSHQIGEHQTRYQ